MYPPSLIPLGYWILHSFEGPMDNHWNLIVYVPHNWRVIAMTLGHTIPVSKSTLSHSSRILDCCIRRKRDTKRELREHIYIPIS